MKKQLSSNAAVFGPQTYKCLAGALTAFFGRECPQIGGILTRQTLVRSICEMVEKFYPAAGTLGPGQISWPTVHKDERPAYGKTAAGTQMTTVVLDLVQPGDAADRAAGKPLREVKKEAAARLCRQAYEQDGCLTGAELAILLKISPSTVSKYIAECETETGSVLPRRGTIHDMGPSITHKRIIIQKLFIEQKTVQAVCRETCHSSAAVGRYITSFKQILLCWKKGMDLAEIAFSVRKTRRLVQEYLTIIEEYRDKRYILDRLLDFEVNIETSMEKIFNSAP
jgi:predicted transcriptional regulator